MDKGPWEIYRYRGSLIGVISGDFDYDVTLEVTGAFSDKAERLAYCEWLAGVLNKAAERDSGRE